MEMLDRMQSGRFKVFSTLTDWFEEFRLYQRQGFRMCRIVQDAFGPSTGYPEGSAVNGIPLRDQVVFERDLGAD
jgi:hypothetical protein